MPEAPRQRISHHRRARSDTLFSGESIDDLLVFDPSDVDFSSLDFLNAPAPQASLMSVDSPPEDTSSNGAPQIPLPPGRHVRSFSVDSDSDFFDDVTATEDKQFARATSSGERKGHHHHRSNSMDGATSSGRLTWKQFSPLILANRQSAARSKERKVRYTGELERKLQTLQNEATTLSAQVTLLQRGTSDLTTENKHLKMRLQALQQQAELRDALNEALQEELNRLKMAAGEIPQGKGNSYNCTQFLSQFGNNKNQQMSTNGQPSFLDFTKRG
ncbi:hypothetical protein YC2023_094235 [Brassica napus]